MGRIAILGGTGPEGLGLALRLALCGEEVVIGSRAAQRAAASAQEAEERLRRVGCRAAVAGKENTAAIEGAEMVVISFPYEGVLQLLPPLAKRLAGRVVLDVVNPLAREGRNFVTQPGPALSAGEAIQAALPDSQVVGAFKNESAEELNDIERPARGDVVVCGDHAAARRAVMELVCRIPDYRAVDAGALVNARFLEGMTALLMNVNRRYRAVTSFQLLGIPAEQLAAR